MGPLLFACFLADVPDHVSSECLLYADDVKIYRKVENQADCDALQADLNRLSDWSKNWRLKLNPAKCKTMSFTLRASPVVHRYTLDGHTLEKCQQIRDLGVVLDTKLTFADHIDATVSKANRMLGLLMRSMQMPRCPRQARFDHTALISAFNAHVRSLMEYGSVIWAGAAVTHLVRLERLQHRFLMWLGSNAQHRCASLEYQDLLAHFKTASIKARLIHIDIRFLHNTFHQRYDCSQLTSIFSFATPHRRSRHTGLFHEPFGRVNTVKNSFITRLPMTCNKFLHQTPSADFFHSSKSFDTDVVKFTHEQGTFLR